MKTKKFKFMQIPYISKINFADIENDRISHRVIFPAGNRGEPIKCANSTCKHIYGYSGCVVVWFIGKGNYKDKTECQYYAKVNGAHFCRHKNWIYPA